jgi:predicted aspartyl protease
MRPFAHPRARRLLLGLMLAASALRPGLVAANLSVYAPVFTRINGPVALPAELSSHAMFVQVMINGRGPFRMLVDTGCSVTVISPELAAEVQAIVHPLSEEPAVGENGLGHLTDVHPALLQSVDVGGVRFEGVAACVSDSFDQSFQTDRRRIDGMLGFSLFDDLYVGLDFPHRRLLLSESWPASLPPVRVQLPILTEGEVPFVSVRIQGRPLDVMIDTGSNNDFELPAKLADTLRWQNEPKPGSLVAVLGEVGRESIGRLAGNLRLGQVRQPGPATSISTGGPSIGVRLLENFCVLFHASENKMWLCSETAVPIPSPTQYTVGLSLISDPRGWRIAGVIPGSPAEQEHVNVGLLVTRIEGRPARSWSRDQIQAWIDSHKTMTFAVDDSTGERTLSLRVWSLVP